MYRYIPSVLLGSVLLGAGALVALGLVLGAASVSAHADYERSEPGRNEILAEPPTRVDVWFTQEVVKREGEYFVRVFDEQEIQVSEADGVVDDDDRTHIFATLPFDLPDGTYVARWMTRSDIDGDTAEGAFCFSVRVEPTADQAAQCAAFDAEQGIATATEAAGSEPTEPATTPTLTQAPPTNTPPAEPTATPAQIGGEDDDGGAPIGAIVGGVIGGVVVLGIVVGGVVIWLRRTLA